MKKSLLVLGFCFTSIRETCICSLNCSTVRVSLKVRFFSIMFENLIVSK
nr:MAG TPA: hypothetical protein [Crassvirales sp.]